MQIYDASALNLGASPASSAYLGSNLVWSRYSPPTTDPDASAYISLINIQKRSYQSAVNSFVLSLKSAKIWNYICTWIPGTNFNTSTSGHLYSLGGFKGYSGDQSLITLTGGVTARGGFVNLANNSLATAVSTIVAPDYPYYTPSMGAVVLVSQADDNVADSIVTNWTGAGKGGGQAIDARIDPNNPPQYPQHWRLSLNTSGNNPEYYCGELQNSSPCFVSASPTFMAYNSVYTSFPYFGGTQNPSGRFAIGGNADSNRDTRDAQYYFAWYSPISFTPVQYAALYSAFNSYIAPVLGITMP